VADTLDLVQLRSLVAIADCGGVGRAAAALHLSQPAVSQHVRLLERRLHRTLLVRDGRQARFTPAGEQLLDEARRILAVHDEALGRLAASTQRALVLGSTETAAEQVLPQVLTTLRGAYPDRGVRFSIDRSTQMVEQLAKGTVDLAIVLGIDGDAPGRLVGRLPLRWFARAADEPALDPVVPLVAYSEPCGMRARALAELSEAGRRVEVTAESTSLEGVLAAARAGLGVAVLPSGGTAPVGLVERTDLPELGVIGVHLAARRGLDLDVEAAALGALEQFFERLAAPPAMGAHHEPLLDAS
jgi:DNA-binding transcriptional LysR family regulator